MPPPCICFSFVTNLPGFTPLKDDQLLEVSASVLCILPLHGGYLLSGGTHCYYDGGHSIATANDYIENQCYRNTPLLRALSWVVSSPSLGHPLYGRFEKNT